MDYLDYSLTTRSNDDELERDVDLAWNRTLLLMAGLVREHQIDPLTGDHLPQGRRAESVRPCRQ